MRRIVGLAGFACALLGACATPRPAAEARPYIRVVADRKAAGAACPDDHPVDVVRGPVPEGMVVITPASSASVNGMRATLAMHETMAKRLARRFCADGISVLTATESESGVDGTTLVLWRRPAETASTTRSSALEPATTSPPVGPSEAEPDPHQP